MFIGWMVHVHYIKFLINLVLGEPPPILATAINCVFLFLGEIGFKTVKYLNITIVGVPPFSVIAGLSSVTSLYLECCKGISFVFL